MVIKCDEKTAGITLGLVFALWHFVWVVLVQAIGKPFLDWVHSYHFVQMTYSVVPFDVVTFIIGLIGAFVVGAITGWLFAWIWNKQVK